MSEVEIPPTLQEAEARGFRKATKDEIDARRAMDFPMELQGINPARHRDPRIVDCSDQNTAGKLCQIGACRNGKRLLYYCVGGVCADDAREQDC